MDLLCARCCRLLYFVFVNFALAYRTRSGYALSGCVAILNTRSPTLRPSANPLEPKTDLAVCMGSAKFRNRYIIKHPRTEVLRHFICARWESNPCQRLRRPLLYPTKLRAHIFFFYFITLFPFSTRNKQIRHCEGVSPWQSIIKTQMTAFKQNYFPKLYITTSFESGSFVFLW